MAAVAYSTSFAPASASFWSVSKPNRDVSTERATARPWKACAASAHGFHLHHWRCHQAGALLDREPDGGVEHVEPPQHVRIGIVDERHRTALFSGDDEVGQQRGVRFAFPRAVGVLSTDQHEAFDGVARAPGLIAVSDISPSPHFSPLPRWTISFFGDGYFGQTCAADARLGAADSTQLTFLWPTLDASSTARSSARIRVEHHFRRDAAASHRKKRTSNLLQTIRPVLHGACLLRPRQGNG